MHQIDYISDSGSSESRGCLREPWEVMQFACLGSFHSSYISFSRSLIRKMIREKWRITQQSFDLDQNGFGTAVYRIQTGKARYHAAFFTHYLAPELRNDRVIATAWDMSCALWHGDLNDEDVAFLGRNLPMQEFGRYSARVLAISRVNKSVRLFDYTVDRLSEGMQPDADELKKTGYLVRTTAVYGNGKFGMADYLHLQNTDFIGQFHAQMMIVYLVRQFTLDWVEHLARCRNKDKAVRLSPEMARFFGTGNSTGLGMGPFLIKHPHLINVWIRQREEALYEIIFKSSIDNGKRKACMAYMAKGIQYFQEISTADEIQKKKNRSIVEGLNRLLMYMKSVPTTEWENLYRHIADKNTHYSSELIELFFSILMEVYPEIAQKYEHFPHIEEPCSFAGNLPANRLAEIIEENFFWAIDIDYMKPENKYFFWYYSQDKEEPRLGERFSEPGAEKEMKIDVGRRIKNLYNSLKEFLQDNHGASIADFLIRYPDYSGEIRRVINYENQPYGEIRENILSKDFYAINILRAKLAFFGAVKFDPKSDRWLRITLFQGAPLLTDKGFVNEDDDWFLYRYEDRV